MSRVVKPINVSDEDHKILKETSDKIGVTLKDYVDSIIICFIATTQHTQDVTWLVAQRVNKAKPFAISENINELVKTKCDENGVSQINYIYSALLWHINRLRSEFAS